MSAPGQREVHERLAPAVTAYRRSLEARTKERQAAGAKPLLKRAAARLAASRPELRDQTLLILAELQESPSGWTADDRWAVLREANALRDEGVLPHVIAHQLIHLGVCRGTGKPTEVQACETWVRKERQRYPDRRTP